MKQHLVCDYNITEVQRAREILTECGWIPLIAFRSTEHWVYDGHRIILSWDDNKSCPALEFARIESVGEHFIVVPY